MTKRFPLLLFFITVSIQLFPKTNFKLVDINPVELNATQSRYNFDAFRCDNQDFLVVLPKINSSEYLTQNNIQVQSYLGEGYYLIATKSENTADILQNVAFDRIGYLTPESKLQLSLSESETDVNAVNVMIAPSVNKQTLGAATQKLGVSMLQYDAKNNHFSAYVNKRQLRQLAELPFVTFIGRYYEKKNMLYYEGGLMMGVNQVQEQQPFNFNLKGEGIKVGVWDEGAVGVNFELPQNRNFVVDKEYSYLSAMLHPTYVAGVIGAGGNYFQHYSIAPRCNLFYWDVANDIVQEIIDGKTSYSVDISNHSYNFAPTNCYESGLYIPEASDLDKVAHQHPTILPVVAVGNTAVGCVVSDTFSSVDIGFQGCKNSITVGWLFPNERIIENSGRGPTADGRLKPELVAKGFQVGTVGPNNVIPAIAYGSSFAAPQVAGLAALLHQKYKQQFGTLPNASLVKALLCNTARDLGKPGPDYIYGFGIPNILSAVVALDNNQFFEDNAGQGQFKTHNITLPSGLLKLSITLDWTDKEGSPIASKALVNDLDLKLVTPAGDTVLPWKLNPVQYKNAATRGVDNLNNIEQVTIDFPQAGTYKIVVKGSNVPFGPQDYSVTYATTKRQIELTHPNGGEFLDAGSSSVIKWIRNGIDSLCTIQFSADSGATWQTVVNNYQLSNQSYNWTVPLTLSKNCLVKITSGNNIDSSASTFSVGSQIYYPSIGHTVCDRTVKISWPAVTGATGYRVYLFTDSVWVLAGETSLLTFTINNLTNGKLYMYSISTIKNGFEGNHSLGKPFTTLPNVCSTLNDVGVFDMYKPGIGRKFTSTALTATQKLSFIIKNYGTATQNSMTVYYKINNGAVRSAVLTDVLTAGDTSIMRFNVSEDMSAIGTYIISAWTSLAGGDNNTLNDTLVYALKHIPNPPISLPFSESFESTNSTLSYNTYGINGLEYADYTPEVGGRFRSDEGNLFSRTGNRAVSLDNYIGAAPSKRNELIFNYNLSNYIDSIIFLDFNYMSRNEPDGIDSVYARGDDTKPWIFLYDLYANKEDPSVYKNVKELNLFQKLKVEHNQKFSASTQLKIVQSGSKSGSTPFADGGYSFDDFSLYVAGKDVAMVDLAVRKINCTKNLTGQPITVKIKNNSGQVINNLPVFYKVDNNPTVSEVIAGPVNTNDTVTYVFNTLFNYTTPGTYSLQVWTSNPGDRYKQNDSINTFSVIVMPTIDEFPYYNDFETNNGNLYSEGVHNSWVWTAPSKFNINNAAQDNKAWTTGAGKGYNFNEDSYLYLGCMDFSGLTSDPLISFHFISVMQSESDSAYVEYSTDGNTWNRLGCYNCGLNWYNGSHNKPYWDNIVFPWQTANATVPLNLLDDSSSFICRIHLLSDNFSVSEGLGIDDIHVLKDYQTIASKDSAYVSQVSTGNGWISFYRNGRLVADLYDDNKILGNIAFGYEASSSKHKDFTNKNILPRNWVIKPQNQVVGNFKLRLYVLNDEYTAFTLAEDSIHRMGDIGLLRYVGLNTNLDVVDNHVRSYYKYYSPDEIQFYPYLGGYYVEFNTDTLGEFYLMSTKQDADAIKNINMIDFSVQKINDDVYLEWKTTKEVNSKEFVVQYSFDGITFIDIDTVPAGVISTNTTLYNFLHELNATVGVFYYRIKMVEYNNTVNYSLIDSVSFTSNVGVLQNTSFVKAYVSGDDIVVDFKNKIPMNSVVSIYNVSGQLQFSARMLLSNGPNPLGIKDFAKWSNGTYFLQIQAGEHNYYSKLLKQ